MPSTLPFQGETPFYVGTVVAKGGKVFYTYIDRDRNRVEIRTYLVWEASVLRDEETTYAVTPLLVPLGAFLPPAAAERLELPGLW